MILYYGSIRKFNHFHEANLTQPLYKDDIDTIGFCFTSDIQSAKLYAVGTETVIEKSQTAFWEDGEPKMVQIEKTVTGYIYKVFIDEPTLKEYEANRGQNSYELFLEERDVFCDYLGSQKRKQTWRDKAILLNKEEANHKFRQHLLKQGYDGFKIQNAIQHANGSDLYCIFSSDSLQIADVWSLVELEHQK